MMWQMVVVAAVIFVGTFTQTVSGFALGVVIMPLLSATLGLAMARPLAALVAVVVQFLMLVQLRKAITLRELGLMSVAGLLGIPLGTWIAESGWLPEKTLLLWMAVLVIGYALYALFTPTLPELKTDRWLAPFAFLSGALSGAYNIGGPPVVIYADARRWSPEQLRSNLQGFFLFKGVVLLVAHLLSGNVTAPVWVAFGWSLPSIGLGLWAGFALYARLNAAIFRRVVLWLLLVMGVNILWQLR